jgi:hypothetical protein
VNVPHIGICWELETGARSSDAAGLTKDELSPNAVGHLSRERALWWPEPPVLIALGLLLISAFSSQHASNN